MRKAIKLLTMLVICSMCLSISAYACAAPALPDSAGGEAASDGAPEATEVPVPDPEPPAEDTEMEEGEPSAETLTISGEESVTLQDEQITVLGADPLSGGGEGYVNGPDAGAAPPWGLGINGGSRALVLTDQASALSLVRTGVTAGGWGALCVDADRDAAVTAVDSQLRVLSASQDGLDSGWEILGYDENDYGSGYGACLTGGASAYFYGSGIDGGTYGAVLDGADQVWFGSSQGTVLLYEGPNLTGSVHGRGQTSAIRGVFGLMMCGDAKDVTVEDGTNIRSADAAVLCKDGSGSLTFRNARLTSDSGVLFQMMDNDDDDRIGLLMDTYSFSPVYDERNAGGGPGFPVPSEDAAAPAQAEDPDALPPVEEPQQVSLTYANGLYSGSIYNGTGYYGQPGDSLTVTVDGGAVLDGDISLTSAVKAIAYSEAAAKALESCPDDVQYCFLDGDGAPCEEAQAAYIQFLRYTIHQYYLQGHVQNLPCYNGKSLLQVTVAPGGTWAVKDTSVITELTVQEGGAVYGRICDNGDGSLTLLPASEPLEPGTYTSDVATAALAENAGADVPAEPPLPQVTVTIAGQEYTLDLYDKDGVDYVRLTDLLPFFFSGVRPPSI